MDSVFYSAMPLIKQKYPNKKFTDDEMSKYTLKIASSVQTYLNKSYDYFGKKFCNLDNHRFEIKQEVIAKSGVFIVKKRYGMRIINDNGVKVDKLLVKGLDIVRSNFAPGFRVVLQAVLEDILANVPKDKIDSRIITFRNKMPFMELDKLATPTGVKGLWKYLDRNKKSDLDTFATREKSGILSKHKKGAPVHVKASIAYNDLLRYFNLEKRYQYIQNGDKIRYVYLQNNPLKLKVLAYKGFEDPVEIMSFLKKYIDFGKMYEKQLEKKFNMLYTALSWSMPQDGNSNSSKFF